MRTNLEVAADRGNAKAIEALIGPDRPYALQHLLIWHQILRRGLGDPTERGDASLTWTQLQACQGVMHMRPYLEEVLVLFDLDVIHRDPDILDRLKREEERQDDVS